jgi:hypothetical protein
MYHFNGKLRGMIDRNVTKQGNDNQHDEDKNDDSLGDGLR